MNLVSINEVSDFLMVKKSTLYAWVRYGAIPSYKLKGLLRFDMEEIEEWVKTSKLTPCNVTVPSMKSKGLDVDIMIKKAIDSVKGKGYNPTKRETSLNQGLRKEVSDESL